MSINVKVEEVKARSLKFTDQFFRFPIKLYLKGNQDMREKLGIDMEESEEEEYVVSVVCCVPDDIRAWYDSFSAPRSMEDVREHGFDITHVIMGNGDDYQCTWPVAKFEEKLNNHAHNLSEKVSNFIAESVTKAIKDKAPHQNPPLQSSLKDDKEPSWWRKLLNFMFKKKKKKITY